MVGTGFNSSEADGISGIGAQQYATPEQKRNEDALKRAMGKTVADMGAVPVQTKDTSRGTKGQDASKAVPKKVEATVPVMLGVQAGKYLFVAQIEVPVPKGETPESFKKKLTLDELEKRTRQYRENAGNLARDIESGAVKVTLMRKIEISGDQPSKQFDLQPRRKFEAYVPVPTDKSDVNAIVRELNSGKGAIAVGYGRG